MEEEKLDKVLIKIEDIGNKVDNLVVRTERTEKQIDNLGGKVDNLVVRMEKTEKQIDNIAVAVVDMREQLKNVPTRDEMNLRFNEAAINVDRFTKLHETLDQELVMMRSKYNRLEERVQTLEQRMPAIA